jgi:oxalate decarboxylase/phosphoglucose isomerase-like protein (cupin superfamily)
MELGFKAETIGKHLILHFKKEASGWKRFVSELIVDRVILDTNTAIRMLQKEGDSIVYEVYNLSKNVEKIKQIYKKTGLECYITQINAGVFSTSNDGELFLTYGHMHEKPLGEFYIVLKNEFLFILSDIKTNKTYLVKMKQGDSILIDPRYLHRMVSLNKDCLVLDIVPEKAGHNYKIVKNKGFPFHVFCKNGKLKIVKNMKYKKGKFEFSRVARKTDYLKMFERNPKKLKDILENPEKYQKLYFKAS